MILPPQHNPEPARKPAIMKLRDRRRRKITKELRLRNLPHPLPLSISDEELHEQTASRGSDGSALVDRGDSVVQREVATRFLREQLGEPDDFVDDHVADIVILQAFAQGVQLRKHVVDLAVAAFFFFW
jgi:hypothetical protein